MCAVAKIISLSFVLIILQGVRSQREGEPCVVNNGPGVCKLLRNCPYADKLVADEMKKPKHCSYSGTWEVVCCPAEEIPLYALGKFGRFFSRTNNGQLVSATMTCHSEGKLPLKCCHNSPDHPLPAEDKSCPAVRNQAQKRNKLVWDKCVEYQRFVTPCVAAGSGRFKREETCVQKEYDSRIFSGDPASEREFPHMALLGYQAGGQTVWNAGGSLISDRYVLTAAHAVTHHQWGDVQLARLGILRRSDLDTGLIFDVVNRKVHSEYSFDYNYHDIALLRLNMKVPLSPYIRPACLPLDTTNMNQLIVTGWGKTGANAPLSEILLKTNIVQYNASYCQQIVIREKLPNGWSDEQMICAGGSTEQANDTCEGDSGGPLQTYIDDIYCMYAVVGVVSWGPSECGRGQPGAYVRVQHYMKWITETIWPQK